MNSATMSVSILSTNCAKLIKCASLRRSPREQSLTEDYDLPSVFGKHSEVVAAFCEERRHYHSVRHFMLNG